MTDKLPYSDSHLTPEQSKAAITKLVESLGTKEEPVDYQWTVVGGQTILKFALPVTLEGVKKILGFRYMPPPLMKKVRTYSREHYRYEYINVSDDKTAWRVLFWYLKNKIIAIKTGLVSAEDELMSHIIVSLPDGTETTLHEQLKQQLLQLTAPADFKVLPPPASDKAEQQAEKDRKVLDSEPVAVR